MPPHAVRDAARTAVDARGDGTGPLRRRGWADDRLVEDDMGRCAFPTDVAYGRRHTVRPDDAERKGSHATSAVDTPRGGEIERASVAKMKMGGAQRGA